MLASNCEPGVSLSRYVKKLRLAIKNREEAKDHAHLAFPATPAGQEG
jgi:hypothetical protein